MRNLESKEQQALFYWIRNYGFKLYPVLQMAFAIPNGGKRNIKTAMTLKKEGVLAGVWDIFIPYPKGDKGGLFIEMKTIRNKLTANQIVFRDILINSYDFEVCYSWLEAKEIIENYFVDTPPLKKGKKINIDKKS